MYLNFLSSQRIDSIRHTGCHHTVTDQYNPVFSKHLKTRADGGWMQMYTIADHLNHNIFIITSCSDHTRCSVSKWRHCIIKVCHLSCPMFKCFLCSIIIGCRMRYRYAHFPFYTVNKFHCSRFFRCHNTDTV